MAGLQLTRAQLELHLQYVLAHEPVAVSLVLQQRMGLDGIPQLRVAQMQIDSGGIQTRMTQELLDFHQVAAPALQE